MAEEQTWLRCGSCGAKVNYSEEEDRFFCPYCGEPFPEGEETRRFRSSRGRTRPVKNAAAQAAQRSAPPVAAPGAVSRNGRYARPPEEDSFSRSLRARLIVGAVIMLAGLLIGASLIHFIGSVVIVVLAARARIGCRADLRYGLIGAVLQLVLALLSRSLFAFVLKGAAAVSLAVILIKQYRTGRGGN